MCLFPYNYYFFHLFSDGAGRTGVFIALNNLIEQVKTEGVVDVYQTVKKMRQQCEDMVQTRVSFSSDIETNLLFILYKVFIMFSFVLIYNKD